MCGNSAYCWNTVLTSRLYGGSSAASLPPIKISPSSGCSKPAISRSEVVLPQPDGPRSDRNSPLCTLSVTASTAVSEPNRLVTARSSTSNAWSLYPGVTPDPTPHQEVLGHHRAKAVSGPQPGRGWVTCRTPSGNRRSSSDLRERHKRPAAAGHPGPDPAASAPRRAGATGAGRGVRGRGPAQPQRLDLRP